MLSERARRFRRWFFLTARERERFSLRVYDGTYVNEIGEHPHLGVIEYKQQESSMAMDSNL